MIYRIDLQHYLRFAIDFFTREELVNINYAIISAKMIYGGRYGAKCSKLHDLWPSTETLAAYADTGDKDLLEKMYMTEVKPALKSQSEWKKGEFEGTYQEEFYRSFIYPWIKMHADVLIICDESENEYVDIVCKCLKEFGVEVIDLNVLFTKGKIGPIKIDMDKITETAHSISKKINRVNDLTLATTAEGREQLVTKRWNTKQKISKLKELGIKLDKSDLKNINSILLDAWNQEINGLM